MKKIFNIAIVCVALVFASCEQNGPSWKNGIGTFSVALDKQVAFSPSNLTYYEESNQWCFRDDQLRSALDDYDGGLDVFGFEELEKNGFEDWGVNTIGKYAPNTWRTLTKDEWEYLFYSRPNANSLYGYALVQAEVDGAWKGLIILPDDWQCPEGVVFLPGVRNECVVDGTTYGFQVISTDDWEKMEKNGAVFLLARSLKQGSWSNEYVGSYFTSTICDDNDYYLLYFDDVRDPIVSLSYGAKRSTVRLVKDL